MSAGRDLHGRELLVLQHVPCEPPGVFEDVLHERGAAIHRVELDAGEPLRSDVERFDGVIVMGGPMSANDDARHPWLTQEKEALARAVRAGVPVFGVCLGAQLLAASLGARVYRGATPEVGVLPITVAPESASDPVFGALPRQLPTLQWHSDTFDLPAGATRLATSPQYVNQAFVVGKRSYGLQFHLETSRELLARVLEAALPDYTAALDAAPEAPSLDQLLADFEAAVDDMCQHGRQLFARWLDLAMAPAQATAA